LSDASRPLFDLARVDEAIHARMRLGIMAHLSSSGGSAGFVELRGRLQTTDGNLSIHLAKLEEPGFVRIEKTFEGKKPLTRAHLTPAGRAAFERYVDALAPLLSRRVGNTVGR
jgi:DNA-binding MarR family transcriptional regulator